VWFPHVQAGAENHLYQQQAVLEEIPQHLSLNAAPVKVSILLLCLQSWIVHYTAKEVILLDKVSLSQDEALYITYSSLALIVFRQSPL